MLERRVAKAYTEDRLAPILDDGVRRERRTPRFDPAASTRSTMAPEADYDPNPYASPKSDAADTQSRASGGSDTLADEPIHVEGVLSPKELFRANTLANRTTPVGNTVGCLIVFATWLFPWMLLCADVPYAVVCMLIVLVGLGLILVYQGIHQLRAIKGLWRHGRGIFEPQQLLIAESGIRWSTYSGMAAYQWSAFSKCSCSDKVVLLHFEPAASTYFEPPSAFLVVPRTFFPSDADWDRFVRAVKEKLPAK
jgi:hypothetical protein